MKVILNFLLRKEVIMIVALLVIGLLIGMQCSKDAKYAVSESFMKRALDSMAAEVESIDNKRSVLEDENKILMLERDGIRVELTENDSIYSRHYSFYNREIRRLRGLLPVEATGILDSLYSDVPTEERDLAILIDLKGGEMADSLHNVAIVRISKLESMIEVQAEMILNKDAIIEDLKRQNEIRIEQGRIAQEQMASLEKQLKKQKILTWTGFGIGAAGIIFGVTR